MARIHTGLRLCVNPVFILPFHLNFAASFLPFSAVDVNKETGTRNEKRAPSKGSFFVAFSCVEILNELFSGLNLSMKVMTRDSVAKRGTAIPPHKGYRTYPLLSA